MKEFDEFRFNRLEERAWQLERELKAREKADTDVIEETEKHGEPNKEAGENHGRSI